MLYLRMKFIIEFLIYKNKGRENKLPREQIDGEYERDNRGVKIKYYNHNSITNRIYVRWVVKYYRCVQGSRMGSWCKEADPPRWTMSIFLN